MGILLGTSKLKSEGACATRLRKGDGGFHYDQVGSVMSISNSSGNLETRIDQDAFPWRAEASSEGGGNVLTSWQSGQWASDAASAGWHHNTKELDGDTGLVFMYQRWYLSEMGVFVGRAPFPPDIEHPFSAFQQEPAGKVDPSGEGPIAAFRCWRLTKKMEKYRKECECELNKLIKKYEEISALPEWEADIEFIAKYTMSGASATHGLAMLACTATKAREDGEDKLVAKWIRSCGLQIPFRPMPK